MDQEIINLTKSLPKYDEIKHLIINQDEAHYILSQASENVQNIREKTSDNHENPMSLSLQIEEISFLVEALSHKLWEIIHTGVFSLVPLETRQIYTVTFYYKIIYDLLSSTGQRQLEKCSENLDEALLIGYHRNLYSKSDLFRSEIIKFLDKKLGTSQLIKLVHIDPIEHKTFPCDIPILSNPSLEDFNANHFITLKPVLICNAINDWPALKKWRDLNYILKIGGNRIVPIEIGSSYARDDFSQQLMKIREFLKRQFSEEASPEQEVEYLAQHELFDQIPHLMEDIRFPVYCRLGENPDQIEIKAWLGPKGTISPMHQDPKQNILCQVFGMKHVILASPDDTRFLYPYESEFLQNTSQINAEHIDFEKFPLAKQIKFYKLTLQEGECLYIPPKWWHYVRSESKSFSVSFWWK